MVKKSRKGYEWVLEYQSDYTHGWVPITVLSTLTSRVKMVSHWVHKTRVRSPSLRKDGFIIICNRFGEPKDFRIANMKTGEIIPVESLEALLG